jgi:uroporphyrinogen decarboxylase
MTSREKFLSVMRMEPGVYDDSVQVPKVEFGYWAGTIRTWFSQGLEMVEPVPEDYSDGIAVMANRNIGKELEKSGDRNVQPVFGLDQFLTKFPVDYSPMFREETIEKDETHILYRDSYGVLCKNDVSIRSLPMELEHPVTDWNSWKEYKQYYDLGTIDARLPDGWDDIVARLKERDFPIRLGGTVGGFLGFPRQLMGVTGYLMALYDTPELIHDMCDTFLEFLLHYYDRILRDVQVDCILIWEDMAGKQGSLISPDHFREFLSPRYRKMVGFAKESGVDIILTDSDGYVEELIPLIVETGVTGMYPFERAAGNDLLRIRDAYPAFQMLGGFDKRALFASGGREAVDRELAITKQMLPKGRYIPHLDHFASPDCTWENFTYYRKKLNRIIEEM